MAFENLWRLEDVSENRKKANVIPINKLLKKDPGNYRPITLISGSATVREQTLLKAITEQMKHVSGKSQDRITTDKFDTHDCLLCQSNLLGLYGVDMFYLVFLKSFSMVSHSHFLEKLLYYGLDKRHVSLAGR